MATANASHRILQIDHINHLRKYMPPLRARHARPFRRCGRQLEPRRRGSTRVLCHAATRNRLHTIFACMGMRQHYVRALRLHQARRRTIVIRSFDLSQDPTDLETLGDQMFDRVLHRHVPGVIRPRYRLHPCRSNAGKNGNGKCHLTNLHDS